MSNTRIGIPFLACALVALLAFAGLYAPTAFAQESSDGCPLEATISSMQTCVEHSARLGLIDNQGVAGSLLAKLAAAQAAQDRGRNPVAVHLLQAFIHEVEAQAGKHIDADQVEHMIGHVQDVIQALEESQ